MKNKPWKEWKTRKKSFLIVGTLWMATAIRGLLGYEISADVLDFIYKGGVWMLSFGIVLVLSDKAGEKILKLLLRFKGGEDE